LCLCMAILRLLEAPWLFVVAVIAEQIEQRRIGGIMGAWGMEFLSTELLRKKAYQYARHNWASRRLERSRDEIERLPAT
jgi:hypothetical protein